MSTQYIDIGINLTDPQFQGIYRGHRKHDNDFEAVLERAKDQGVHKMLITGSNLEESEQAIKLALEYPGELFATAGIHPCHAEDVPKTEEALDKYFADLEAVITKGKADGSVKALGELGLDYDRLHYAGVDAQKAIFRRQLDLATRHSLPLFLHSRACAEDFKNMLGPYIKDGKLPRGGVVHSFTGTVEEMQELVELGLYIGVNGCSMKTEENLEVVKAIPMDKLLLETDGPWCEIRPSHASFKYTTKLPYRAAKPEKAVVGDLVRGRCEPSLITNVAQVVAGVKDLSVEEVATQALENTKRLFDM